MNQVYMKERNARILTAFGAGSTYKSIAAEHGLSVQRVQKMIRRATLDGLVVPAERIQEVVAPANLIDVLDLPPETVEIKLLTPEDLASVEAETVEVDDQPFALGDIPLGVTKLPDPEAMIDPDAPIMVREARNHEIRVMGAAGKSNKEIAEAFGVTPRQVQRIRAVGR